MTNFIFADRETIWLADRNELIVLDAKNGNVLEKGKHDIEKPEFILQNEREEAVIGGRDELA